MLQPDFQRTIFPVIAGLTRNLFFGVVQTKEIAGQARNDEDFRLFRRLFIVF